MHQEKGAEVLLCAGLGMCTEENGTVQIGFLQEISNGDVKQQNRCKQVGCHISTVYLDQENL